MNEHSQYPPGSQEAKTEAACESVVNSLIKPGKQTPKSNIFALCMICNAEAGTHFAIKASDAVTREDVFREIQRVFDSMRKELNEAN